MSSSTRVSRLLLTGLMIVISTASRSAATPPDPSSPGAPPAGHTVALLATTVNNQPDDEPIMALRDERGTVLVAVRDLARWRMRIPSSDAIEYAGDRFIALSLLPGVEWRVDEGSQSLTLSAPPALFTATSIDALPPTGPVPQRTAIGGFANYTLLASHVDTTTTSGSFEVGAFGRFGTVNATGIGVLADGDRRFTRLDTTWAYAMPQRLSTIRAGDAITRPGAWGNALRFGGVQFATDFATQPNLVLAPGQFATGQATVPSTVDVYINNAMVTQQQVRPGPFSITNIPPITGAGNVTLIVRDELGREQLISRPFYASQALLRPGLTDFSIDIGMLRENYGIASADYDGWVVSGTYRRGLTDRATGEVRAEALEGLANAGVAGSVLVGDFGVAHASVAAGHNREGNGGRIAVGFERQARGLSFAFSAMWRSPDFRLAGEIDAAFIPRREWLASADHSFGRYGSLALAYVSRAFFRQPTTTVASIGYSLSLGRYGYVAFSMSRITATDRTTTLNALWTIPLDTSTSVGVGIDRVRTSDGAADRDGRSLSIQRNLPVGDGWGYRARIDSDEERRAQLDYQNRFGTYSIEVAQAAGQSGQRITASGGLGVISGNVFMSRAIYDSFGLVRVPGYADVRVYAENRLVGRTDASGELVVPRLLPYLRNPVRIDQADLPLDAEIGQLARDAVPFARSGVVVDFDVKPSRGAIVTIVQPDGTPVPAGAQVRVDGQEKTAPVALDGAAYLTGLSPRNRAAVTWRDHACAFEFDYPATTDPQPAIGPFICR